MKRTHFAMATVLLGLVATAPCAQAAPDDTRGMAILAAHVSSAGVLLDGSGATSASKFALGQYYVSFDRDITGCYYLANPIFPFGFSRVSLIDPTTIYPAFVKMDSSAYQDTEFQVVVYCAR